MELYSVMNAGAVGFISAQDAGVGTLPPEAWTTAHNVRFSGNLVKPGYGWAGEFANPWGERVQLDYLHGYGGVWWLAYGQTKISTVFNTYQVLDCTRLDKDGVPVPYTDGDYWSTTNLNGIPVATNGADAPQAQFEAGVTAGVPDYRTRFIDLPGWYAGARCRLMIAHKNFLIGANFIDDGKSQNRADMLWWSDAAAPGDIPDNWDYEDRSSKSGRITLGADTGPITAMKLLHDAVIVYTAEAVYRLLYVGGEFGYEQSLIASHFGAQGPFAVDEARGRHVVVTQDDIVLFDGQQEISIAKDRVRRLLNANIDPEQRQNVIVAAYPKETEVWVMFPSVGSESGADQCLVWNWEAPGESPVWATRDLPGVFSASYMPELKEINLEDSAKWDETKSMQGFRTWDDWIGIPWNGTPITGEVGNFFLFAPSSVDVKRLDTGFAHEGVEGFAPVLEKRAINVTNDETAQMVLGVYPRMKTEAVLTQNPVITWDEATGPTNYWDHSSWAVPWDTANGEILQATFDIGTQDTVHSPVVWRPERPYDDSKQRVTTRARGRRHAIRLRSGFAEWAMSGYDIVFAQAGQKSKQA